MNFQQLTYIIAIDRFRHFARAAEHCHVTQPTLSTMVNRLEEELGVKIFDRSRSPVMPTETGKRIIAQARRIREEVEHMQRLAGEMSDQVEGELRIGVIPTVAPYLLPLFLPDLLAGYPGLRVTINELTTSETIARLKSNMIDAGILATPLGQDSIRELPLYNEPFVVYRGKGLQPIGEKYITPNELDPDNLWLLEEGHCLRSQIAKLCELRKHKKTPNNLVYEAGSIDSLKRLVDANDGITILPELSVRDFSQQELASVQYFREPLPARQISIVTYRHHLKEQIVDVLKEEIQKKVSPLLAGDRAMEILEV
ncbi:LysR substrate-binding domain-containing protein [Balneolales bacterium ANBcel1]|nr:LysR substrate-binding domain-containing protein [Balneolales bacterium ANBcel1]